MYGAVLVVRMGGDRPVVKDERAGLVDDVACPPPGEKSTVMVAWKEPLPGDRLLLASATMVDRTTVQLGSEGSTHVEDVKLRLVTARWSCLVPVLARAGEAVATPPSTLSSAPSAMITPIRLMAVPPSVPPPCGPVPGMVSSRRTGRGCDGRQSPLYHS